jgi:hypothetical protein
MCGPYRTKESRRLVLPRTSCFLIISLNYYFFLRLPLFFSLIFLSSFPHISASFLSCFSYFSSSSSSFSQLASLSSNPFISSSSHSSPSFSSSFPSSFFFSCYFYSFYFISSSSPYPVLSTLAHTIVRSGSKRI